MNLNICNHCFSICHSQPFIHRHIISSTYCSLSFLLGNILHAQLMVMNSCYCTACFFHFLFAEIVATMISCISSGESKGFYVLLHKEPFNIHPINLY